jgi:hypothetical protein
MTHDAVMKALRLQWIRFQETLPTAGLEMEGRVLWGGGEYNVFETGLPYGVRSTVLCAMSDQRGLGGCVACHHAAD